MFFEGPSLAGNRDGEARGKGELEIAGAKETVRAAHDTAQDWTGLDFPIRKACCWRMLRVIDVLPDCPWFGMKVLTMNGKQNETVEGVRGVASP